jgi:hypothetical protein
MGKRIAVSVLYLTVEISVCSLRATSVRTIGLRPCLPEIDTEEFMAPSQLPQNRILSQFTKDGHFAPRSPTAPLMYLHLKVLKSRTLITYEDCSSFLCRGCTFPSPWRILHSDSITAAPLPTDPRPQSPTYPIARDQKLNHGIIVKLLIHHGFGVVLTAARCNTKKRKERQINERCLKEIMAHPAEQNFRSPCPARE